MSDKPLWVDRTWELGLPDERLDAEVARLAGAPDRIDRAIRGLPQEDLTHREEGTWSILENVGHLLDLEALLDGRLDDFEDDLQALRPADMTTRRTRVAGHNGSVPEQLLGEFRSVRGRIVQRLRSLTPELRARRVMHPRVRQPMRPVDPAYFHAEHDDHHIARIEVLASVAGGTDR